MTEAPAAARHVAEDADAAKKINLAMHLIGATF
jgi:hypothetical protein